MASWRDRLRGAVRRAGDAARVAAEAAGVAAQVARDTASEVAADALERVARSIRGVDPTEEAARAAEDARRADAAARAAEEAAARAAEAMEEAEEVIEEAEEVIEEAEEEREPPSPPARQRPRLRPLDDEEEEEEVEEDDEEEEEEVEVVGKNSPPISLNRPQRLTITSQGRIVVEAFLNELRRSRDLRHFEAVTATVVRGDGAEEQMTLSLDDIAGSADRVVAVNPSEVRVWAGRK